MLGLSICLSGDKNEGFVSVAEAEKGAQYNKYFSLKCIISNHILYKNDVQ